MAEPGGEHPLVEPLAGVAERGVERLTLAGGQAVEQIVKLWMRVRDMASSAGAGRDGPVGVLRRSAPTPPW